MFGELFEGSLRFEEHLPLAIDGAFTFFEQRSHAIELRLSQPDDRISFFQLPARPLCSPKPPALSGWSVVKQARAPHVISHGTPRRSASAMILCP